MSKSRSSHSECKEEYITSEYIGEDVNILPTSNQQVNPMSGSAASTESSSIEANSLKADIISNSEKHEELKVSSSPAYPDKNETTVSETSKKKCEDLTPLPPIDSKHDKDVRFSFQSPIQKDIPTHRKESTRRRNSITKNPANIKNVVKTNLAKDEINKSKTVSNRNHHLFSVNKKTKKTENSSQDSKKNNCVIF
jgi:hypothetical protein